MLLLITESEKKFMSITLEQVQEAIHTPQPTFTFAYTPRDVCLYALGVGACADPMDANELPFVYELHSDGFKVLPTYPVIFTTQMIDQLLTGKLGPIDYNPMMLVHGEQFLRLFKPIPPRATITSHMKIANIYDKGSGMLVVTHIDSFDETGEQVAFQESSMFIRGLGGWGGERGTSTPVIIPERPPDAVEEQATLPIQALIYRLSGDINPLHADPMMAAIGNFERPILHGLSSFGFAGRAVLKHFCHYDVNKFKSIRARFSKHVFPGETLVTEMWRTDDTHVVFQTKVKERGEIALSHAVVEIA